jgi:hypothetical protein
MRDHTKLRAFELADEVALLTYKVTQSFPREEQFGLTSQMRRAAVSVPSNIVEGCGRDSNADYIMLMSTEGGSRTRKHLFLRQAARRWPTSAFPKSGAPGNRTPIFCVQNRHLPVGRAPHE